MSHADQLAAPQAGADIPTLSPRSPRPDGLWRNLDRRPLRKIDRLPARFVIRVVATIGTGA